MSNICGKNTALTLYHNNTYTALPYSAETLRQTQTGYYTKETIASSKSIFITTGRTITGCFVTRIDAECASELFAAITGSATLNILHDCVAKRTIYHNITLPEFELRAEHESPIYLRCTINPTHESYTEDFTLMTPDVRYDQKNRSRTWQYDGRNVTIDGKKWPYIYRFCLTREKKEDFTRTTITVFYPLTMKQKPQLNPVKQLVIPLDAKTGADLTLNDLVPIDDGTGVESSTEILVATRYRVNGTITYEQRPFGGEHKVVHL